MSEQDAVRVLGEVVAELEVTHRDAFDMEAGYMQYDSNAEEVVTFHDGPTPLAAALDRARAVLGLGPFEVIPTCGCTDWRHGGDHMACGKRVANKGDCCATCSDSHRAP